MTDQPVIERIPAPLWCLICSVEHGGFTRSVHLATHTVDGTSVCSRHLSAAIERARAKRRGQ